MKIDQAFNILTLALIVHQAEWYFCELFLEPKVLSDFEESFVLDDVEYVFTNRRITWEEAEIGCSTVETGSLAIIDSKEKAKFLALAMAETDLVVEDLWIGATVGNCSRRCSIANETNLKSAKCAPIDNRCFKWLTGDLVKDTYRLPRYREISIANRECLSFARNDHHEPIFVDLYCRLLRPYMCQRPAEEEEGSMTHQGWIRIGNYEYAIFYAKKTWKESVRECFSKHKAHLADFREMKEIVGIGKYLLTGRPSLENAWIGAQFKLRQWRYISTNKVIPRKKNPETQYPPWPDHQESFPEDGCLLLDRHLEDGKKLVFLQARCHRKRSYICSRKIADNEHPPFEIIIIDDVCYTLFYNPKTWQEAYMTCIDRDSWLVEVTEEKIDHILYIMGENRTEINHIWIGGKLRFDNHWYWEKSNDSIVSDSQHIYKGYPPWLDYSFDLNYGCLNLDRENHNKAIFYGVHCEEKQPFICQQYYFDQCRLSAVETTESFTSDEITIGVITTTTPKNKTTIKTTPEEISAIGYGQLLKITTIDSNPSSTGPHQLFSDVSVKFSALLFECNFKY